jgi:hypothetical protein
MLGPRSADTGQSGGGFEHFGAGMSCALRLVPSVVKAMVKVALRTSVLRATARCRLCTARIFSR